MKEWGVQILSERKLRMRANGLVENKCIAEYAMFSFPAKSGEELKTGPTMYLPYLSVNMFNTIQCLTFNQKHIIMLSN